VESSPPPLSSFFSSGAWSSLVGTPVPRNAFRLRRSCASFSFSSSFLLICPFAAGLCFSAWFRFRFGKGSLGSRRTLSFSLPGSPPSLLSNPRFTRPEEPCPSIAPADALHRSAGFAGSPALVWAVCVWPPWGPCCLLRLSTTLLPSPFELEEKEKKKKSAPCS